MPISTAPAANSALTQRWMSAVVALPIFVGICVWGATPFVLLTILLALIARSEITKAYQRQGIHPNGLLSLLGALTPALLLTHWLPFAATILATPISFLLFLVCGLVAASLWETGLASHERAIHTGRNMAYGLLCGAYVSLFSGVALLRTSAWQYPVSPSLPLPAGGALVLVTMACTMAGDSAGFFVGRAAGRHKLAANLSPKKTLEGLIGGIAASFAIGGAMGYPLLGSTAFGLLIGAAAAILGPMGDLFKSALKREIGIKDFGSLIPGHGGVLDRFDSLLFTCPVVVLLVKTFGPG